MTKTTILIVALVIALVVCVVTIIYYAVYYVPRKPSDCVPDLPAPKPKHKPGDTEIEVHHTLDGVEIFVPVIWRAQFSRYLGLRMESYAIRPKEYNRAIQSLIMGVRVFYDEDGGAFLAARNREDAEKVLEYIKRSVCSSQDLYNNNDE